jgi:hypothetical protein
MTQGTEKILGGTPYKRYPDPNVSNLPNEFGLYPWSVFRAKFVKLDPITNRIVYADPTESFPRSYCLLFLSDFPALARTAALNNQYTYYDCRSVLTSGLTTEPGGGTLVTLPAYGQVAAGYTGDTGQVYCTGFPVIANYGNTTLPPSFYFIEVTANSPVINTPIGDNIYVTPVGKGVTPVILKATDYTAAIKAADNIIVSNDGANDVAYVVVGLWFTTGQ